MKKKWIYVVGVLSLFLFPSLSVKASEMSSKVGLTYTEEVVDKENNQPTLPDSSSKVDPPSKNKGKINQPSFPKKVLASILPQTGERYGGSLILLGMLLMGIVGISWYKKSEEV